MHVSFAQLQSEMKVRLIKYGVPEDIAEQSAKNLAENTCGGVASHGINRFTRIIAMLENGNIKPAARPQMLQSMGALEQWDGGGGMGNTNAAFCMQRAVTLAKEHGIGCVALRNTNHWQRAGAFGILAAKAGCAAICWTNTLPNMPAWGAKDRRIGNNPLVFAVPYQDSFVMVDAAMAQFSYGAIETAEKKGNSLPVAGGFDSQGKQTTDPAEISKSGRVLPIGFWKGSGFSILLDLLAATLSGGMTVNEIGKQGSAPTDETNLSQIFIAMNITDKKAHDQLVAEMIEDLKQSEKSEEINEIFYPGERSALRYEESMKQGAKVDKEVWETILAL